ncbi:hypothetical protein [uncultured Brachyspira sp.]|uniref:hypothetical protein n=1 Tax=uncultured Brachyspira sp. TaxID=221953 RepID=UPI00259BE288|nr:hypothetical protein [uncultured Brachyspira sp.]
MKRREEKSITLLTNILSFKLLIALLSILLFLISCKSNENPNAPGKPPRKKHELEGTWVGYDNKDKDYELKFTVDSDGNITFYPKPYPHVIKLGVTNLRDYPYTGKVKTNSIVYPYTNDVTCDYSWMKWVDEGYGKFVFSSPSNCTAKYNKIGGGNNTFTNEKNQEIAASLGTISTEIVEFTKQ